jgi:hypothetical protein
MGAAMTKTVIVGNGPRERSEQKELGTLALATAPRRCRPEQVRTFRRSAEPWGRP